MEKQNQDFEQKVTESQNNQQNSTGNEITTEKENADGVSIWGNLKAWLNERWLELTIGIIVFMIISPIISKLVSGVITDTDTYTYTYTHEDGTKCSFIIDFEGNDYQYSGYKLEDIYIGYYFDKDTIWEKDGYIWYEETVNGRKKYWSSDFKYYFFLSEDETTLSMGGLTFKLE